MNKPFDWDVFLSHSSSSSSDMPRVARLAERGLERSRVLVLCMTKAAFESEWVRLEQWRWSHRHDR